MLIKSSPRKLQRLVTKIGRNVDEAARTVSFVVSTGAEDRDGDVVDPNGWSLDRYRKNPIVLWAHDYRLPPVAKAPDISVTDGALRAVAQFPDEGDYEFADTVFRLYAGGYLSAVSAGFRPLEQEKRTDHGNLVRSAELWEFSAVPVPSNPEALVQAKSAKIDVEPIRESMEQALDDGFLPQCRDAIHAGYIALTGKTHPVIQRELARKNGLTDPAPEQVIAKPSEPPAEPPAEKVPDPPAENTPEPLPEKTITPAPTPKAPAILPIPQPETIPTEAIVEMVAKAASDAVAVEIAKLRGIPT